MWKLIVPILSLLLLSNALADDVYLLSGFVFRNVQILDTTANSVRLKVNDRTLLVDLDHVFKIEKIPFDHKRKSTNEMFSEEMNRRYLEVRSMEPKVVRVPSRNADTSWAITNQEGITWSPVSLVQLYGDTLFFRREDDRKETSSILIYEVARMELLRDSDQALGFAIGAAVGGAVAGAEEGEHSGWYEVSVLSGAVLGGLIGLVASSMLGIDYTYVPPDDTLQVQRGIRLVLEDRFQ